MGMGRLISLKPRLATLGNRLASLPREQAEAERLRVRDQTVKWRGWYKTAAWEKLRQQVFVRDRFTCQKTGELLVGVHPEPNSPVAHHKKRHHGDETLFWDIENIETVSKAWHDGPGQAEERRSSAW